MEIYLHICEWVCIYIFKTPSDWYFSGWYQRSNSWDLHSFLCFNYTNFSTFEKPIGSSYAPLLILAVWVPPGSDRRDHGVTGDHHLVLVTTHEGPVSFFTSWAFYGLRWDRGEFGGLNMWVDRKSVEGVSGRESLNYREFRHFTKSLTPGSCQMSCPGVHLSIKVSCFTSC